MKLRIVPHTATSIGAVVVLVTSYARTAMGKLQSSVAAGMSGLKPLMRTFTGSLLSERLTCPKG